MIRKIICNWLLNRAKSYIQAATLLSLNPVGSIGFEAGGLYLEWSKVYIALAKAMRGR